jgi:protein-tyrosine phosphatase
MTRRLLVVCTANVCRSAAAERILAARLAGRRDVDGHEWVVRSAGTADVRAPLDRNTVAALQALGLDLTGHTPRVLTREVLAGDGADLVLTMTREHLRHVVALDPTAWPRTFTLKELARRAGDVAPATDGGFVAWRERLAAGRRAADLMTPDPADDVADPYGAPRREHERMLEDVTRALGWLDDLVRTTSPAPPRSG